MELLARQSKMSIDSNQRLEYLYKEYARLSDRAEEAIKSAYDDFKLFGVVGAVIIIWKPLSELILSANSKLDSSLVLFLGFLGLLGSVGLVSLLNLMKQFQIWHFVHNLQAYEMEIRKELRELEDSQVFNFNMDKESPRYVTAYRLSYRAFVMSFFITINLIPFVILCYSNVLYAVIYLSISLFCFFTIYVQTYKKVIEQYFNKNYFWLSR